MGAAIGCDAFIDDAVCGGCVVVSVVFSAVGADKNEVSRLLSFCGADGEISEKSADFSKLSSPKGCINKKNLHFHKFHSN